jgi:hypothetical protein
MMTLAQQERVPLDSKILKKPIDLEDGDLSAGLGAHTSFLLN